MLSVEPLASPNSTLQCTTQGETPLQLQAKAIRCNCPTAVSTVVLILVVVLLLILLLVLVLLLELGEEIHLFPPSAWLSHTAEHNAEVLLDTGGKNMLRSKAGFPLGILPNDGGTAAMMDRKDSCRSGRKGKSRSTAEAGKFSSASGSFVERQATQSQVMKQEHHLLDSDMNLKQHQRRVQKTLMHTLSKEDLLERIEELCVCEECEDDRVCAIREVSRRRRPFDAAVEALIDLVSLRSCLCACCQAKRHGKSISNFLVPSRTDFRKGLV
eukprot:3941102-Rhodomonas_salina.5